MRRLLYILPALLFAGLAVIFMLALRPGRDPSVIPSPLIGKPVPAFTLPGLKGEVVTAADLTGGITILNVFASWCIPCRAEHPVLMRVAREGGVRLIGLSYKDDPEAARAWLDEHGDPYAKIAIDRIGRVAIDFGVYGVPETFVIDATGHIRYKHVGPLTPESYADEIVPVVRKLSETE